MLKNKPKITISKIAKKIDGESKGDPDKTIVGVASFENANEDEITFVVDKKFLKNKKRDSKKPGAVIIASENADLFDNAIIVKNPQFAFAKTILLFNPEEKPEAKISEKSHIVSGAVIGKETFIGEFAYIGKNAAIGERVAIHPCSYIGDEVTIGDDSTIFPNVTIYKKCKIGKRVLIHSGSVIGADGYGYIYENGRHNKIPQIGIVEIEDDVEIGAGNTIDRGTLGTTRICSGVKTDNLVHIAHNVIVGENTLLIAQAGIAGSAKIGDNAIVGPQEGVTKSVENGKIVSGTIREMPHRQWLRVQNVLPKLPELKKRIEKLEKKIL